MRQLIISDIHGCNRTFRKLLDRLELSPSDRLILGGDYIDRGPDSKGVIDTILELKSTGIPVQCLLGNHEAMLLEAHRDEEKMGLWFLNGGDQTVASFGLTTLNELDPVYLEFFENLDWHYLGEDVIVVHAGLNFRQEDPLADDRSKIWIRAWYDQLDRDWLGDRILVHGHTPVDRATIEKQLKNLDRIPILDIDCGCVYPLEGKHQLCAFDLTQRQLYFEPYSE